VDVLFAPATGKPVSIAATGIYIVKDGKLAQNQVTFNRVRPFAAVAGCAVTPQARFSVYLHRAAVQV
jgi:hypothetical protein